MKVPSISQLTLYITIALIVAFMFWNFLTFLVKAVIFALVVAVILKGCVLVRNWFKKKS